MRQSRRIMKTSFRKAFDPNSAAQQCEHRQTQFRWETRIKVKFLMRGRSVTKMMRTHLTSLHFGALRKGQSSKKRVASTTLSLTPVDANRFADDRLSRSYRSNTQQYIRDAISGDHKAPVPLQPRRYLHEGKIRASPCLLLEPSEQTRIFLLVATIADGGNRSFLCRNKTLPV